MFISQDLLPLRTVESQGFRNLLQKLDPLYQVPTRKSLSNDLLKVKRESVVTRIKSRLRRAQSVCLTIDLWSNRQMKGYIGVTAHFILDWALESATLACKRVRGRHTADNIRDQYQEIVMAYELRQTNSSHHDGQCVEHVESIL